MRNFFVGAGLIVLVCRAALAAEDTYEAAINQGIEKNKAVLHATEKSAKEQFANEARLAFGKSLKLAQTDNQKADAQLGIAHSYEYGAGDLAKARQELAKVVAIEGASQDRRVKAQFEIARSFFSPWSQRGAYAPKKDVQKAQEEYTKALDIKGLSSSSKAQVFDAVAGCCIVQGNREQARAMLAKIIELEGFDPHEGKPIKLDAQIKLGQIAGNPALARAEYTKALEMGYGIGALQLIAYTYRDENNPTLRRATLKKILQLPEATPAEKADAQIDIAQCYEIEKNFPEARAEYERLLKTAWVTPYYRVYAHFLAAKNCLEDNQPQLAKIEFQKVVELTDAKSGTTNLATEAKKQLESLH